MATYKNLNGPQKMRPGIDFLVPKPQPKVRPVAPASPVSCQGEPVPPVPQQIVPVPQQGVPVPQQGVPVPQQIVPVPPVSPSPANIEHASVQVEPASPASNLIVVGVPCYKVISIRTSWSIMDLMRQYNNIDVAFQSGVFVHENQNKLVEIAREKKASHLFLVEHDIVFEASALQKLLDADKDVICAPYSGRMLPRQPLVYQKNPGSDEPYMMSYDVWPDKPFKVYGVPTGCTLIKMSVFDKLKKPYFFFDYTEDGVMKESQDIRFSKKVGEAGMECWCDPTIGVVHIGEFDF